MIKKRMKKFPSGKCVENLFKQRIKYVLVEVVFSAEKDSWKCIYMMFYWSPAKLNLILNKHE